MIGMEQAALNDLLAANLPAVRAFVRLRTNQAIRARESVSDLVQSVCREVLQGAPRLEYRGDAAFRSWLFTTALRKIVERDRALHADKRDIGREVAAAGGASGTDDLFAAYATVTTPSKVVAAKEQMAQMEAAFDQLSEEHREIITLSKIAGLSHKEIAEQTGSTEEACRQLLRRAMVKLTMILER